MSLHVAVAGAGLSGRMLAEELSYRGHTITLVDRDGPDGVTSCGHTGAGMLAPFCELEHAEPLISTLGCLAMPRWTQILPRLATPVFYQQAGSLVVAHSQDRPDLERLQRQVMHQIDTPAHVMQRLDGQQIGELEPELQDRFSSGLFFPQEAQVDNRQLMDGLRATLQVRDVTWRTGESVVAVQPGRLVLESSDIRCDVAIDCRGLGARDTLTGLRGVRGEVARIHAPDVQLTRPVRLMHPRYPIYIVPRQHGNYVIGATQIESDDMGPVSVQSVLELLSAAYTIHKGFAEARLIETEVNCRPAYADNLPRLDVEDGLIRINGLFRHGFLLSPAIVLAAADLLDGKTLGPTLQTMIKERV